MCLKFALLILLGAAQGAWADPAGAAIEKAQALTLKKNRQAAARVLDEMLRDDEAVGKSRAHLTDALGTISRVFFTDKGQKLFEAGQSAMFENPDVALARYREALVLEDNNLLILDNIARVQLAKQDCDGAATTLQKARQLFKSLAEPAVLELRTLICQKNFEAFRESLKRLPPLEKGQENMVQYLAAQDFMQQKQWRKASEVLLKISELDPQFPETYFLLTKAGHELDRDVDSWAQKYVSLCKGVTPRERRRFSLEPRLCVNAKEVQDELLKKTVDL